ncbi:MAG: signal peptidase I [Candidatus Spechtbacterales bacterium]
MNEKTEFAKDIVKIVFFALLIIVPIRYFVVQPFFVEGASMEATYHDGDYLLVDKISYLVGGPARGEVIVFRFPNDPKKVFIKRIIGLPRETVVVERGIVTIYNTENPNGFELEEAYLVEETTNSTQVTLGGEEYFVMGDNRDASYDSRGWGPLKERFIIGKVFLRAWPFSSAELVATPSYSVQP